MHLDDVESERLKTWIIKRLEDINSDADSDVLADYVLALLKSDEPDDQVKQNCLEHLEDFLSDKTALFVNSVFEALDNKSYDPSRLTASSLAPTAQSFTPGSGGFGGEAQQQQHIAPLQPSRKRSFQDEYNDGQYGQQRGGRGGRGDRPMKQMRRGGRGYDTRGGFAMETPGFNNLPGFPALPPMDPNNPMASIMALQQMMGMPGMPQLPFAGSPQPGTAQPHRTGKRCRDYDTKGFCARGAACMYDHGNDHLVAPDTGAEYDPTNASLAQGENGMSERGRGYDGRGRGRGRGRGDRGAFRGGRGGRAEFSSAGPNHDRSITSVVVEQIPEEKFNEDSVREFFSEFGNIEEVTMQEYKRLAIIKYDDYSAAKRAYDSPKVIFENRFVKVYWYKPDSLPRPQGGHQNGEAARPVAEDVEMKEIETIDPVELAKKQEEAQRVHEEKKKQFEAAQAQRQELEEKMRQQAEERRKLVAKLAAKERTKSGTPDVGTQANGAANGTAPKDSSQTEALKAKLAALEKEAVSMGINPDEEAAAESWQGFPPRGRGGYRVRGAWQPRGAWRGRGRGGFVPRGGSVMRLDNRPKSIAVTFPDGDEMGPDKDEALKQYLLFSDLMESAEIMPHSDRKDSAVVKFTERYKAEQFFAQARNIPHIGKVELSWVPSSQTGAVPATPTGSAMDFVAIENVKHENGGQDIKMEDGQDGGRAEVDYDVADDDDRWLA